MRRLILILPLAFSALALGADECRDLRATMDLSQKQIEEFVLQQAELNEKFKKFVEADFNNQTEGVLDEISRNSALKVVHARKRLKQAIESKQMALLSAKNEFCQKCSHLRDGTFCSRCPNAASCATAKKN